MARLIFMGSPEFALPSLEALHKSSHEILAVASQPDKRRGRGSDHTPTPVKRRAQELGYPIIETETVREAGFVKAIRDLAPELLVVVAFRILPPEILEIPAIGSINLHASLLPQYRGAAPIHWAIMNGERETGCSVFFLEEELDTGRVIRQIRTRIDPDETTGDLYNRLKTMGSDLLVEAVDQIEQGDVQGVPQDDSEATLAPKLFARDAHIDFSKPAEVVHNRIRGLNPFPGAWAHYGNMKMNLCKSRLGPGIDLEPGELIYAEGRMLLAGCGDGGSVEIRELQLPGKKRISGQDFANSYNLSVRLS